MARLFDVALLVVSSIVWRELLRWNRDLFSMRSLGIAEGRSRSRPPNLLNHAASARAMRRESCDAQPITSCHGIAAQVRHWILGKGECELEE